ncbi:hypothetical protein [Thermomonospora umbrina]|uniref:Uncharacterized protein n=1 Tax=Thermomonospora umbrina TaxID=111806 RepID=A0A3D9SV65_9ACTN|nr:hypothetical protein [Thermomonospora umbrina]REE99816.1 hypothetical protein DFJ69_5333 [Thermomonospora umbrina]
MGLLDNLGENRERRRDRRQERAEAKEQREAGIDKIVVSTLCTTPWAYEPVTIVWGRLKGDPRAALRSLMEAAYEERCDAVLGVGFVADGGGAELSASTEYRAYGTGVRWAAGAPAPLPVDDPG